jgi:hypothetical protein
MQEVQSFKLLGQISTRLLEAVQKEITSNDLFWIAQASANLASDKRRTLILKRFPGWPVKMAIDGVQAADSNRYDAPAEWIDNCLETKNYDKCPHVLEMIEAVKTITGFTDIGLTLISELQPGGEVKEHIDEGAYFTAYHRIHIPIVADAYSNFTVGGETVNLTAGEIWLVDNLRPHSVHHNEASTQPRVNLYFDAK